MIYQGTCHLDQTNPLVIGHLFVDLPRTPKEAGIPGYHKIVVFATIYSKAFCYVFPSINCSQNSWMQHIHFGFVLDYFGSSDAFGTQLSTKHHFSSEEIYMSYSFFVIEKTSETSPNICLIMFRPLQIVSLCQI